MPIDKSKALRAYSIPESQYDELLLEFITVCEEKMASLNNALSKADLEDAAAIIHAVKGMSGNMMLDDCFAVSRTIENCIKQSDLDMAGAEIKRFRHLMEEIRSAISKRFP